MSASGVQLHLSIDTDWAVSTSTGDHDSAEITFHDAASGSEVTLAGDRALLVDRLETALADLVDAGVVAAVRDTARDGLPLATTQLRKERLVTPDSMEPGGWVRLPNERQWRKVAKVTLSPTMGEGYRQVAWAPARGFSTLRADTTFPYRTAAEMEAEAPIPSDRWGNGVLDSFTGPDDPSVESRDDFGQGAA